MFNNISHPRAVIDLLTDVWNRSGIIKPIDVLIVDVRSDLLILLEIAIPVTYTVGALTDVVVGVLFNTLVDIIISVVTRVGAAILPGVNVIVLVAVVTALEFAMTEALMLLY